MCAQESGLTETPEIQEAVHRLGEGGLTEAALGEHIRPLFSRVLARSSTEIYLINHSMGRPLDRTARDVQEAIDAWYVDPDEAWDVWLLQMQHFREQVADLINAPAADCIVPRSSAGQGLRAVLNAYDHKIDVLASSGEFNSIDLVLKVYAQHERINLTMVAADVRGHYALDRYLESVFAKPGLAGFVIDLVETDSIDSTNFGILARIATRMEVCGGPRVSIVSNRVDINEALLSMGLDEVFDIVASSTTGTDKGQELAQEEVDEASMENTLLKAHRTLMSLNERNQELFREVVSTLEQEIAGQP